MVFFGWLTLRATSAFSTVLALQGVYKPGEVNAREVEFSVEKTRIIEVDTAKECFEASFEIYLRWPLRKEDGMDAWDPPKLLIRNAKGGEKMDEGETHCTCVSTLAETL